MGEEFAYGCVNKRMIQCNLMSSPCKWIFNVYLDVLILPKCMSQETLDMVVSQVSYDFIILL